MYGQSQVLACGCVGACTCFSEPYPYGNHWYTQDANGYQYLWTGSGWVNASSAEAQSVLAADTSGVTQHYADPASGAVYDPASGTIYQSGGYWYTQGSDGYQYVWTTGGWLPAALTTGDTTGSTTDDTEALAERLQSLLDAHASATQQQYVDPASGAVVGPPAVGDTLPITTDDPGLIQIIENVQRSEIENARIFTGDSDGDGVPDEKDADPFNRDIQTSGGFDPNPSVDTNDTFIDY